MPAGHYRRVNGNGPADLDPAAEAAAHRQAASGIANYLRIYANRPAPAEERRAARRTLMASAGVDVSAVAV